MDQIKASLDSNQSSISEDTYEDPLLLFPALTTDSLHHEQQILQETISLQANIEKLFPHAHSIAANASFKPGIYLSCTGSEQSPYADSFRLVLPYRLGANRRARTSSLTLIEDRYSELYQLGYDEYGGGTGGHDAQLSTLFDGWRKRLNQAHAMPSNTRGWGVNEHGVDGIEDDGEFKGIDIFKNADEGAVYATCTLPAYMLLNSRRCAAEARKRMIHHPWIDPS